MLACHSGWQHDATASDAKCSAPPRCARHKLLSRREPGDRPHGLSWLAARADPCARESGAGYPDAATECDTWESCNPCPPEAVPVASEDDLSRHGAPVSPPGLPQLSGCRLPALPRGTTTADALFHRQPDGSWWSGPLDFCRALPSHTAKDQRPLFGRRFPGACRMGMHLDAGAVDGTVLPNEVAFLIGAPLERFEDALPGAITHPAILAVEAGSGRAIALWQVSPRCSGAHKPEDAVDDATMLFVGSSAPSTFLGGQQGLQPFPLTLCQVATRQFPYLQNQSTKTKRDLSNTL